MIQLQTLPELLKFRATETPKKNAHWIQDKKTGDWLPINYQELYQEVVNLSWELKALGIKKGHVVGIMAATTQEWELIHLAVLSIGAIVVGIDPREIPEHIEIITKTAEVQFFIVDRIEWIEKLQHLNIKLKLVINFGEKSIELKDIEIAFIDISKLNPQKTSLSPLSHVVGPEDIATIIYTSGTTGSPKGIAYRHHQIISAIDAIIQTYPEITHPPCRLVCWLPLSNLFQRIVNFCAIAGGAEVFFVEQPQKIIESLPKINPHIFIAVPRFYEKLYQSFENKLAEQPKIVGHTLKACLKLGEADSAIGRIFRRLNSNLFKSFTALFGNNIRYMVSGSAPMPLWLLKRYNAMGLLILEAYGLSENVVPIAANRLTDYRFGCVGKALKGNQLKLTEDGELFVKGIGVFSGYLSNQQHDRSLSVDGYLATGDYAEIDAEGFIHLIGRKSEIFKTSTGRKIAPVAIEALFQNNPSVEHAVVIGERRKFLIVLITVGIIDFNDEKERIAYVNTLTRNLALLTLKLPNYQQPVGGIVCFKSLSVQKQELTTNLKLKRTNIQQHYKRWIDDLYAALEDPQSTIDREPLLVNPDIMLVKF